ncbi:MAG: glycoside hydrolase family 76 protein [Thermotogae bacterium]|jgi:rhamnogalacturonyl hydrolase YesR|nr:glycoside hydrolase family 76 protein [Thermotogota bacterium]
MDRILIITLAFLLMLVTMGWSISFIILVKGTKKIAADAINNATVLFEKKDINNGNNKVSYTDATPTHYIQIAEAAVNDLIRNYWVGTPKNGYIIPTWNGYPVNEKSTTNEIMKKGGMWERGIMIFAINNLYHATGNPTLKEYIASEWNYIKKNYTLTELETPGGMLTTAVDDCGWDAMLYLIFYKDLGDPVALEYAEGLVDNAFNRWLDDKFGGGMWYNDYRIIKSLYQVGIVLSALKIWELTGEKSFYDKAFSCYQWMEQKLLRPDGLYWCDYDDLGPVGERTNGLESGINEAGSVTFLGGNMAMGVIQAILYKITGEDTYRQEAIRTANAIAQKETKNGIYLDDRDAWTDGSFAGEWATKVLTLPGISETVKNILYSTANAIYYNDRTSGGYYGGCWDGPINEECPWNIVGSKPQQIMTSASAVDIITAAALLASKN